MKNLAILICLLFVTNCTIDGAFKGDNVFCGSFRTAQEATVAYNLFHIAGNQEYSSDLFSKYISLPNDYKKIDGRDYYYYGQECLVTVEVNEGKVSNISATETEQHGCVTSGRNLGYQIGQYTWTINTSTDVGCLIKRSETS